MAKSNDTDSSSSSSSRKKRRLGRGLSSLMGQPVKVSPEDVKSESTTGPATSSETASLPASADLSEVPSDSAAGPRIEFLAVDRVRPNPHQPRGSINETGLAELAASIRSAGVMQPILVRPASTESGPFEIVAGERRWRAAQLAGLATIPAIVREINDQESAEWAIVENVQREDLNPIEKAEAFRNLIDEFGLTQSQVAERVGLDRSSVANLLRLNQLDARTKDDIRAGRLSQGHAKALLSLTDEKIRRKMAEACLFGFWSVRELEKRVDKAIREADSPDGSASKGTASGSTQTTKPEHVRSLETELTELLGLRTEIKLGRSRNSGKIQVAFGSVDEFESLVERLRGQKANA